MLATKTPPKTQSGREKIVDEAYARFIEVIMAYRESVGAVSTIGILHMVSEILESTPLSNYLSDAIQGEEPGKAYKACESKVLQAINDELSQVPLIVMEKSETIH